MTRRMVVWTVIVVVVVAVILLGLFLFNQPTEVTGYSAMALRSP